MGTRPAREVWRDQAESKQHHGTGWPVDAHVGLETVFAQSSPLHQREDRAAVWRWGPGTKAWIQPQLHFLRDLLLLPATS